MKIERLVCDKCGKNIIPEWQNYLHVDCVLQWRTLHNNINESDSFDYCASCAEEMKIMQPLKMAEVRNEILQHKEN